jgi:hypothetical protein
LGDWAVTGGFLIYCCGLIVRAGEAVDDFILSKLPTSLVLVVVRMEEAEA